MEPGGSQSDTTGTLVAEHAQMLADVNERAQPILAAAQDGPWPAEELHRLLDYLHVEVLRQVVDEEWLLFRAMPNDSSELADLRRDHHRLREAIDDLTATERLPQHPPNARLAADVRTLQADLEQHLRSEQATLGLEEAEVPSTAAFGAAPHSVYALVEGPVIDLDELRGPHGVDAVLGRLLRLRRGEQVELRASADPLPLWRRLAMSDPGGYGFSYLERGPERWRAEVDRRAAV